jgi:O-antigen/teichoic acid export membrane protein
MLAPEEVGVFAVGAAMTGILSVIQQLGLPTLIIREEVVTRSLEATAFTVNLIFSIIISIVIATAGSLANVIFDDSRVEDVMYVLALCPLLFSVSFLPAAHLERSGDFKILAIATVLGAMSIALSTILLLYLGLGFMSLAYAQLIGSAVTSALLLYFGRKFPTILIGFKEWRRITTFSFRIVLINGSNNIAQRLSEMSLAKLAGLPAIAFYNRANSINSLIWWNVHSVIAKVFLVHFSEAHREGRSLAPKYLETTSALVAILWPAYLGIALLAPYVLTVVYGAQWTPAAVTLSFLCVASAVAISVSLSGELFLATGNVNTQARLQVKRAMISTVLFVVGALISLEAAAATRIIDSIIVVWLYRPHVKAMAGVTSKDLSSIYKVGSVLTVLALAPSAAALLFAPHILQHLWGLMSVVMAGVLFWGVGLHLVSHPILRPLHKLIEARRTRV